MRCPLQLDGSAGAQIGDPGRGHSALEPLDDALGRDAKFPRDMPDLAALAQNLVHLRARQRFSFCGHMDGVI